MREYKIYKTDLWYGIYRKKYVGKILLVQYLNWHNMRTPNKNIARTFYNQESAMSALVIVRAKKEWDIQEQKDESEKQSWSELS